MTARQSCRTQNHLFISPSFFLLSSSTTSLLSVLNHSSQTSVGHFSKEHFHVWCALRSPACKELVSLCLRNPCLTLVVRYLLEFNITPNRVFSSQRLLSRIFYNSPDNRSLLFPHCRALLLTAHGESGLNSPYDFSLFL